jgi:hypothetical protein
MWTSRISASVSPRSTKLAKIRLARSSDRAAVGAARVIDVPSAVHDERELGGVGHLVVPPDDPACRHRRFSGGHEP